MGQSRQTSRPRRATAAGGGNGHRVVPALPFDEPPYEQDIVIVQPDGRRWPFRFRMATVQQLLDMLDARGFYDHAADLGAVEDMLAMAETPQQRWQIVKEDGKPVARRGVDIEQAIEDATVQLVAGLEPAVARRLPGHVYAALIGQINAWLSWEVVPEKGPKERSYATWSRARAQRAPRQIRLSTTPGSPGYSMTSSPTSSGGLPVSAPGSPWTVTLPSQPSPPVTPNEMG